MELRKESLDDVITSTLMFQTEIVYTEPGKTPVRPTIRPTP